MPVDPGLGLRYPSLAVSGIVDRKTEHIRICLEDKVESGANGGFDGWRLDTRALPEIARDDVDLSTTIAGKRLAAPLIIGAMTGGTLEAGALNRILAAAAERHSIGFALGSGLMAGLALFSWLLVSLLVVLATFQWARGKRLALRLALPGPAWLIAVGSTWLIWQPLTIVLLLPVLVLWPILPAAWLGTMVWVPVTLARDMRAEPDATPM